MSMMDPCQYCLKNNNIERQPKLSRNDVEMEYYRLGKAEKKGYNKAIVDVLAITENFRKRVGQGAFLTYSMLMDKIEALKEE